MGNSHMGILCQLTNRILREFPRVNPLGNLIRSTFDFEWLHNYAIIICTFLCTISICGFRPPAGMGNKSSAMGVHMWKFPYGNCVGIPTDIPWE